MNFRKREMEHVFRIKVTWHEKSCSVSFLKNIATILHRIWQWKQLFIQIIYQKTHLFIFLY